MNDAMQKQEKMIAMLTESVSALTKENAYLKADKVNLINACELYAASCKMYRLATSAFLNEAPVGTKLPSNKLKYPISDLIKDLQKLPVGTTYEEEEGELWGGETDDRDLGTEYQRKINIVEGFNPARE